MRPAINSVSVFSLRYNAAALQNCRPRSGIVISATSQQTLYYSCRGGGFPSTLPMTQVALRRSKPLPSCAHNAAMAKDGTKMKTTHVQDRLLALGNAAGNRLASRSDPRKGSAAMLPCPLALLLLQWPAESGSWPARRTLRRRRRLAVGHWRKYLVLRVRVSRTAMLHLAAMVALQRPAEAGHGARSGRRAEGHGRRRVPVVVREQAAGAMYGPWYPRGDGLVDGDGAGGAVVRRVLVAVARVTVPFALALALSFLVAAVHFFVLLDGTVPLVHVAIRSIVGRRAAAAVKRLAVHDLSGIANVSRGLR